MQKWSTNFFLFSLWIYFHIHLLDFYYVPGNMQGIEDINLDTKIQRRISKQHSTILGTAEKKSEDIYLYISVPMEVEQRTKKIQKKKKIIPMWLWKRS